MLEQGPFPPPARHWALRRLLDEVLLVLAQHHAVLHLVARRDVVEKVELVDEEVVGQVHVGDALLLGEDARLGLAVLEVLDEVVVDEGALVAEERDGREEVVLQGGSSIDFSSFSFKTTQGPRTARTKQCLLHFPDTFEPFVNIDHHDLVGKVYPFTKYGGLNISKARLILLIDITMKQTYDSIHEILDLEAQIK